MSGTDAPAPKRRHDPQRRERIVAAALAVIAREGVAGTSHRRVAAEADVPLGSMTYHFDGMADLLHAAFSHHANTVADRFDARMRAASAADDALATVVALVAGDVFTDDDDLVLAQELYTLAARDPSYRDITTGWMRRSRAALETAFDAPTARILDAAIEGLTLHAALGEDLLDRADVVTAIERIAGPGRRRS